VNQTLGVKVCFCFPGAILLLDGKTLKSRHLVETLFFLPREAEAATIRFEASAHGDINAGASFGGTPNQAGKETCDPRSPWQRSSNANTNRLLRQYFRKGSDLSVHSQTYLNKMACQ
jgi:hypothetical protein